MFYHVLADLSEDQNVVSLAGPTTPSSPLRIPDILFWQCLSALHGYTFTCTCIACMHVPNGSLLKLQQPVGVMKVIKTTIYRHVSIRNNKMHVPSGRACGVNQGTPFCHCDH